MIEVTFIDLVLFAWAIIATGYMFFYKSRSEFSMRLIRDMVSDPTLYAHMRDGFDSFKKQFVKN